MPWFSSLFAKKAANPSASPSSRYFTEEDYDSLATPGSTAPNHTRATSGNSIQFPPKPKLYSNADASSSSIPPSPGYLPHELNAPPAHPSKQHTVYASSLQPSYPALKATIKRMQACITPVYPEIWETLSYPLPSNQWSAFEAAINCSLPQDVKEYFTLHDGQDVHSLSSNEATHNMGLFWGLWLMTSEEVVQEWTMLRMLERKMAKGQQAVDDPFSVIHLPQKVQRRMKSCPSGWVKHQYSNPSWIPLLKDDNGNYIGIDLDPPAQTPSTPQLNSDGNGAKDWSAVAGRPGQVIAFGREIDTKTVLFPGWGSHSDTNHSGGWARFLSSFADDLEAGEFGYLGDFDTLEEGTRIFDDLSDQSDDGLGDLGYYEQTMDIEDNFISTDANSRGKRRKRSSLHANGNGSKWRLRHPYKGIGVIDALCKRSRQRWTELGVVSAEENTLNQSIASQFQASTSSSVANPEFLSSVSSQQSQHTDHTDIQEILPSLPASPHLVFSPPSPEKHARFETMPDETNETERTSIKSPTSPKALGKRNSAQAAPPPLPLGIPTMHDILLDEDQMIIDSPMDPNHEVVHMN